MRFLPPCLAVLLLLSPSPGFSATASHRHHPKTPPPALSEPFKVGGLEFDIPPKWISVPPETPARAGQWRVPADASRPGGDGRLVAFYFGVSRGGATKENIDGWIATMFNADNQPAAAEVKIRRAGGLKITQAVVFGTYAEVVSVPGIPPIFRPNYGLVGTVVENAGGNIYWRFTGPESLITANLPLFNKMIDGLKPATP